MRKQYFEDAPENGKYNFAVALARCFENSLLDGPRYDRLIESDSVTTALKILHDTPYGSFIQSAANDFETVLLSRKREVFSFFKEHCVNEHAGNFVFFPYDYHNLKAALKSRFSRIKKETYSEFGSVPVPSFRSIAEEERGEDETMVLPPQLEKALESALESYYVSKDPRDIDYTVDRNLYMGLLSSAEGSKSLYLKELLSQRADLVNAVSFLRLKKQGEDGHGKHDFFVPGGKIDCNDFKACLGKPLDDFKDLLAMSDYYDVVPVIDAGPLEMEKKAEEIERDFLKQARFFLNGFEPLVSFCLSADIEIKNLRKIFVSKINKIPFSKFGKGITEVV